MLNIHLSRFLQASAARKTTPIIIDKYTKYKIVSPYAVKYAQLNKEPTTTDIMLGIKNFMNSEN